MNSRKKIINELRFQLYSKEVKDQRYPVQLSASDAYAILALLKEQEPQPAIIEGFDVAYIGRCPSCNVVLLPWGANYCYKCGQAVKWDE